MSRCVNAASECVHKGERHSGRGPVCVLVTEMWTHMFSCSVWLSAVILIVVSKCPWPPCRVCAYAAIKIRSNPLRYGDSSARWQRMVVVALCQILSTKKHRLLIISVLPHCGCRLRCACAYLELRCCCDLILHKPNPDTSTCMSAQSNFTCDCNGAPYHGPTCA